MLIEQDVLLLAGAEDLYVPVRQLQDQIRSLTRVHSLIARLFTRHDQVQNHVHVGNIGLSLHVIPDWISQLKSPPVGVVGNESVLWRQGASDGIGGRRNRVRMFYNHSVVTEP